MFYWDWTMILVIPGLLLGIWAQYRVSSSFSKYSKVTTRVGQPADEVARELLNRNGVYRDQEAENEKTHMCRMDKLAHELIR